MVSDLITYNMACHWFFILYHAWSENELLLMSF